MTQRSDRGRSYADRWAETLQRYEVERMARPAWRGSGYDRLFARVIDIAIPFLLSLVTIYVLTGLGAFGEASSQTPATEGGTGGINQPELGPSWGIVMPGAGDVLGILSLLVLLFAYEVLTTLIFGATPGKRFLGLKVTGRDGKPLHSPLRFVARTALLVIPIGIALAMWFTSVLLAWGAVAVIVVMVWRTLNPNSRSSAFYDLVVGTDVADARAEPNAH